ncbi:MAG: DEAD/DEAH box helicase [Bacteroidales bacterium]|nr:DEAD/DEAH box helicase [Bacteroidales bacterium]
MTDQVVFSFFIDSLLGVSFSAKVGERMSDGSFGYDLKRLSSSTLRNYDLKYSDIELKIISLADELTHKSLLKNFSKKHSSLDNLLSEKNPAFLKTYIRKYIDQRLVSIIELCRENSIPLFFVNSRGFINSKPLLFTKERGNARYHFNWSEEDLLYALKISVGSEMLDLQQTNTIVLTDEPAFLIHQNNIISVQGVNGNKLRPFLKKEHIHIRQDIQKKYFETFVYGLLSRSPVEAHGFSVTEKHEAPEAILKLTLDWQNDPVLIPRFKYRSKEIPADYSLPRLVSIDTGRHPPSFELEYRHKDHEEGAKNLLLSLGLVEKGASGYLIPQADDSPIDPAFRLVDFMRKNLSALKSYPFTIRQETNENYNFSHPKLEIKQHENNDWFDLDIIIEVGEYRIPFRQIRIAILSGEKRFILPDGSHFIIPDEWFSELPAIAIFGEIHGELVKLHKMHHLGLMQNHSSGKRSVSSEELIKRFFSHAGQPKLENNRILRPYQKTGVHWLSGLQHEKYGGILADDMGLGKTLQILTQIKLVKESVDLQPTHTLLPSCTLIVVPVSVLHNWENEISKFSFDLSVYRMTGANRKNDADFLNQFDIVLTTYGILRNDIESLQKYDFLYFILDESQSIKNSGSQVHRAARQINAAHRVAMTGTPVENSLTDLWAQFAVVNPGLLGSEKWFRSQFLQLDKDRDDQIQQKILKQIIRPFILRRTKETVAPELPQVNSQVLYCDPTSEQQTVYEKIKSEVRNYLLSLKESGEGKKSSINILSSLTRLRLISNHPALSIDDYTGDSGKTNEILNRIQQVVDANHKVLVFSQFVKHLKLLSKELLKLNIRFTSLTGQDNSKTRETNINAFESGTDIKVFLISLKAGGTGLNLTAADYVFLLDPWWNPAVEEQAISRAHRIGQTKPVFVYRFITTGTLEEKIIKLQDKKRETADLFVNNNALSVSDVNQVLELLSEASSA